MNILTSWDHYLAQKIQTREQEGLLRVPTLITSAQGAHITIDQTPYLLFCSNDYLGLAGKGFHQNAWRSGFSNWGGGAGASRIVSGHMLPHQRLEEDLARWVGQAAALYFSSGYALNVGVIPALVGSDDVVFSDELNHASLIDGVRLARAPVHIYPHGNVDVLRKLLEENQDKERKWIVTESVFSMDGDLAPLADLVALKKEYNAWLYVDEAHALGVFGNKGEGRVRAEGFASEVEVVVGTLGKAVGCSGAFVAGTQSLYAWLFSSARSFAFSTAPPPVWAEVIRDSIKRVRKATQERKILWRNAQLLKDSLNEAGFCLGASESPIIPVIIGEADKTVYFSYRLRDLNIFIHPIRPPTVPVGTSRLRIVPTATHSEDDMIYLIAALKKIKQEIEETS